ncbi:NEDD4-binding protein 1-like isoform X1 [Haliotis cracherodii]|uniref:NEDD4-binding protein 1-like isoform X1 n=2 Tax=Haliotis cracherodii TaxID=6455 RepID=UPI0039E7D13F
MSATESSDEFIVCRDKVGLIDALKSKVERLYGTRVFFHEVSNDGGKQKRWVSVTGGKWDRQNAKSYILGLSDPEETKVIKCSADFLDDEILENVEKNTNAVLIRQSSDSIKISGNELAVTLALSALEELTGCSSDAIEVDSPEITSCNDPSSQNAKGRAASQRLDDKLEETFGEHSGSLHYPDKIKRVFLEVGQRQTEDVSDQQLHGSGVRKTASEVIVRARGEDTRKVFTAPVCRKKSSDEVDELLGKTMEDGVSGRRPSEEVSTVTEQFTSAAHISPRRKGQGSDAEELKGFAASVGYTDEEIEEGFLYAPPPMKPADFLSLLMKVKEGKERLGVGTDASQAGTEEFKDDVVCLDDDIMIVEDHFQCDEDKQTTKGASKQGGLSQRDKQKNEQKQKDLEAAFRQQQSRGDRTKQLKAKSPKHQSVSGTKRKSDPDSDQEQTCVMKLWEAAPDLPDRMPQVPPRQQRLVASAQDAQHTALGASARAVPQVRHEAQRGGGAPQQQQPVPVPLMSVNMPRAAPPVAVPVLGYSASDGLAPVSTQQNIHTKDGLRYVIIDGSNVAMFHGNSKIFSCKGIQIAVDYFLDRGHKVTVFIPEWRKYRNYHDNKIRDQDILLRLEESEHLVFTPSRKIQGKLVASYDDRYILGLAEKEDSVILSNDQYRDLMKEKASWKKIIEERLLMYRFVGDHFMPAEDPLGRHGPMLDEFLRKHPQAPRGVPAQPRYPPQAQFGGRQPQQVVNVGNHFPIGHWEADGVAHHHTDHHGNMANGGSVWQTRGRQPPPRVHNADREEPPKRIPSVTEDLFLHLKSVFPEKSQEDSIRKVLDNHSSETDLNRLTNYCMEVIFQ